MAGAVRAATAAQLLAREAATPDGCDPGGPAVLVLDRDDRIVAADAIARRRLALLPDQREVQVPGVVAFLAARARARAGDGPSTARMRARDGRWLTIDASALDDDAGSVAVVVQPAAGEAVLDGVLRSLGLSGRERQVAALCARGQPTKVIAAELSLSPWTVQDHLQAIYAKTGAGTRPELAALFGTLTAAQPAKSAITERVAESPPDPYTAPASQ